ncbi:MAG TPA: M20 family metallopeptidase [Acidobacteriota bacterium]|nr:M20 family metallopeptidase [Acidobacteriota bacterium]
MDVKAAAKERLESLRSRVMDLSHTIHANPETGFNETRAAAWICELLSDAGLEVQAGIHDLPTAFLAKAGQGPLHVCFCAEYDALPAIGHACGHNIIAAAAVGAGIAAAAVADEACLTVSVLGTPAEEIGDAGGKILLLERGAFDGVHAAMMVHPAPFDVLMPKVIAASMFEVRFTGKEAHASAFPEMGINAADALTVAQTSIGLLRQHILPTDRIHGIIVHGGDAPNIVPGHTAARYIVRGETLADLERLRPRVYRCFEAGALATGCKLEIVGGNKPYSEMIHDPDIAARYKANCETLGRSYPIVGTEKHRSVASTDMGNVSLVIPSIQPMIGIQSFPAVSHQKEFAAQCVTTAADQAVYDGALAMAWTAIDLGTDARLRDRLLAAKRRS